MSPKKVRGLLAFVLYFSGNFPQFFLAYPIGALTRDYFFCARSKFRLDFDFNFLQKSINSFFRDLMEDWNENAERSGEDYFFAVRALTAFVCSKWEENWMKMLLFFIWRALLALIKRRRRKEKKIWDLKLSRARFFTTFLFSFFTDDRLEAERANRCLNRWHDCWERCVKCRQRRGMSCWWVDKFLKHVRKVFWHWNSFDLFNEIISLVNSVVVN